MIWKVTTTVIFPLRGFRHWWTWNYGKLKIPFQAFLQPPIKSFIIIADMLSEEASRLLHGWPTNDQFAQHQNDFFVCVCVCGTNASYTLLPLLPIIENKNGRWLSRSIQWTSVRGLWLVVMRKMRCFGLKKSKQYLFCRHRRRTRKQL